MLRRTIAKGVKCGAGFQREDPVNNPMTMYSPQQWNYNFSQVMHPPTRINQTLNGPHRSPGGVVNRYLSGVWIDIDMHPVMRVALAPYLNKLQTTRKVPTTDPTEAVADFTKVSPLVGDDEAKLNWLAKVIQLCGFKGKLDIVAPLWAELVEKRFISNGATEKPPLALILSYIFCCSKAEGDSTASWGPVFDKCLKEHWNMTPHFQLDVWNAVLYAAGKGVDGGRVISILEEMIDVQVDLDKLDARSLVRAFNVITEEVHYEKLKKFLFALSPEKVTLVLKSYKIVRRKEEGTFKENNKIIYHIRWHEAIRNPQKFCPRQLFFDYKPLYQQSSTSSAKKNISDILSERIAQWKEEGLLPEDYVFDGNVTDHTAKFKNVMRHEHWAKLPKILKDKKYGYCGEH